MRRAHPHSLCLTSILDSAAAAVPAMDRAQPTSEAQLRQLKPRVVQGPAVRVLKARALLLGGTAFWRFAASFCVYVNVLRVRVSFL